MHHRAVRSARERILAMARKGDRDLIDCDLQCICGSRQSELLDGDAPVREVLAKVSCRSCGRLGCLSLVAALEHPSSIDPNDIT